MSLPRYVNDKYKEILDYYIEGIYFFANSIFKPTDILKDFYDKQNEMYFSKNDNYRSIQYSVIKKIKNKYKLNTEKTICYDYDLTPVKVQKFSRLRFGKDILDEFIFTKNVSKSLTTVIGMYYHEIYIPKKFENLYNKIQLCKYNNEVEEYIKNPKAYLLKNKLYKQRVFPPSLKNYIFNRDNFTCQICNKHKSQLPKKIHLEVDHIIAWQDGGQTTLSNGQTVCSDCNKGKHHSKKYLNLIKGGK